MAKILWKILPIAIGLAFGFMITRPPELFRSLGWQGWLILPVCFILLIFIFYPGFSFVRQIFQYADLIPVEVDMRRRDVRLLVSKLLALGFKPTETAFKIPGRPATIIGFVREDIDVSGIVIRVDAGFGKTTFCFASSLGDDTKGLVTVRENTSALSPRENWSFCQIFPKRDVEELFLEHLRSLEFLHSRGLKTYPVSVETFKKSELEGWQKQKEFLRKKWLKNTIIFVWRFASKINPYRGPIARQKIAAKYLKQIDNVPAETVTSAARLKIISDMQVVEMLPIIPIHSGVGIASFVIPLAIVIINFAMLISAVISAAINGEAIAHESPLIKIFGSILMLGGFGYLTGLVLGIKGAFMRHRKKLFAVLGIILNTLGFVILSILILIGIATH